VSLIFIVVALTALAVLAATGALCVIGNNDSFGEIRIGD